ncbi:hypothetical protein APHAL10511_007063 [Amanita phalloides]|nr:hypothetical protein APHAL10511_007063 [Amanita phalloides]
MTTLPLFWHLSSASKKERIDASVKLVGALEQFQAKFIPKETLSTSDSDAEQDDDAPAPKLDLLDALNAQDVSYSIRRLVRGLGSSRESSRLGFAVALTGLLSRINTVTCTQIINLMLDGTKIQGSMTGQEERDMLFARLFGFTSVIQSGLLVRMGALPTSLSTAPQISSLPCFEQMVKELFALGQKKSWLRESSSWAIGLALDAVHDSEVAWKAEAVDFLLQHLFVDDNTWSSGKVALTFKLQEKYPSRDWNRYLSPPFKNASLLHPSNLQSLGMILKESGAYEEDEDVFKLGTSIWKPELHFVWDIILDHCLLHSKSESNFQEFYRVVVDESLFASTSSSERKYWGFKVFNKALPQVTQAIVPMLFTKNFMRSWINHLSKPDRYLHKIARQVATDVQTFIQNNPQLGFSVILQLSGTHGHQQFDRLTKTKTVESILTAMDESGIQIYIKHLYSQFNEPDNTKASDISALRSRRAWIVEQLAALIHNPSVPKSDEWIRSILDWLTVHALFVVKKKSSKSTIDALHSIPQPAVSEELSRTCRNRLLTCLGDLGSQTVVVKMDDKSARATGVTTDGEFWISKVLKTIDLLQADTKHATLRAMPSSEARGLHSKARETLSHLREVKLRETAQGAELLLSAALLQSHCETDLNEGTEELEACIDGVVRFFLDRKKSKKSRANDEPIPEPIDLLVDLIIGFMEKSTAYLRTIGNQAFALLSDAAKESTIDLILTQLERRDLSELLNDAAVDGIDVEMDDEKSANSDGESEDSVSNSESDTEDVDPEFRNKIEEVFRTGGMQPAEDASESEDLLDDEQMMAIDRQLTDIFKSRIDGKRKDGGVHREATHFKNRVLDLVDTFIKRQPSSTLNLRLINPLVEILASAGPDERQLADKTRGIIRTRLGKSKEIPLQVDLDTLMSLLDTIHTRARKSHSAELLPSLSQCSIYLSRIMLHHDAKDALLAIYRESLVDFFTRKNSALNTVFFQDFMQRFPSSGWSLRDDLLDLSTRAVNAYRQSQALHLIENLLLSLSTDNAQFDVAEFMPKLNESLTTTIEKACDEKLSLPAAQVKQLLKLAFITLGYLAYQIADVNKIWIISGFA